MSFACLFVAITANRAVIMISLFQGRLTPHCIDNTLSLYPKIGWVGLSCASVTGYFNRPSPGDMSIYTKAIHKTIVANRAFIVMVFGTTKRGITRNSE